MLVMGAEAPVAIPSNCGKLLTLLPTNQCLKECWGPPWDIGNNGNDTWTIRSQAPTEAFRGLRRRFRDFMEVAAGLPVVKRKSVPAGNGVWPTIKREPAA